MKQEEALRAFKLNQRVWIETEDSPRIQMGRLAKRLDGDFFLFQPSAGIMDYAVHCSQIYQVQERRAKAGGRLAVLLQKLNFRKGSA